MSFLPTVPGTPFMIDTDGTVAQGIDNGGTPTALTGGEKSNIIDGNISTNLSRYIGAYNNYYVAFVFPESRDITGMMIDQTSDYGALFLWEILTSVNTTDGVNGTWVSYQSYGSAGASPGWGATNLSLRQNPVTLSWIGIKGVRLRFYNNHYDPHNFYLRNCIFFGNNYSYAGLRFWHATLDQPLTGPELDLGDVAQNGIYDRTFRIKNANTLTANSITLTKVVQLNNTAANIQFSDGGAYANTLMIPTLAPSALTGVITLRRTVGAIEQAGLPGQARITAATGSWT